MVTVDDAIRKGRKMIFPPIIILLLGGMAAGLYMIVEMHLPPGWFFAGLAGGIAAGWLYWSIAVTKWRIWAYENVRNVHELTKKARRYNLIPREGSFLEKTEIINSEQEKQLERLKRKFLEKDVYHDDFSVPKETLVFYSKTSNAIGMAMGLLFFSAGLAFLILKGQWFGLLAAGLGIFILIKSWQRMNAKEPQILMNDSGIKFFKKPLVAWSSIFKDEIFMRQQGKHVQQLLGITHSGGYSEISIGQLSISVNEIEKRLIIYRLRSEKNNS